MFSHSELASRTLTFLFTDLESSTSLWEQFPQTMEAALERHDTLLRAAVEEAHGQIVKSTGDGLMAVFASALDGLNACLKAQHSLQDEPWGETGPLRVRMGLHVGEAQFRDGDYYGPAVNRAARLMSAAHGGQVLLSGAAASLVIDLLPEGVKLRELGEHRLKDLARPERIFQLLDLGLISDFPPLASLDLRPNNLPAQPSPMIGREAELNELVQRLSSEDVRLVTLTGPGGIGKTRLALQTSAELIDCFEDGVFFVDLGPIRDPEAVLPAISRALGLRETSDRLLLDELVEQLQPKKVLLLLDNFEQVTSAASQAVKLLQGCPQLKLLVTSREALHVRGEHIVPVPPLALPEIDLKQQKIEYLTQYEAVRLFIERAQAVKSDFTVTNENAPAVAEICVRLDGLPLAIELAAARVRLFSPQALLERLGTRLKLLQGGPRDLPVRQQTLRNAIQWSYELLEPDEQWLFELLSVFSGGCSLEAIEAVASGIERLQEAGVDFLDKLTSLVDKSLIRQMNQESGEPRLVMLETIREYAADRLKEDVELQEAVQQAHAAYFAGFTRRQWERLTGDQREAAMAELLPDIENVRTAWSFWVAARDLERLNQFVDSLWLLYDAQGWYHATVHLTNDLLNVLAAIPSTPERAQEEILLRTSLARALLAIKGYTPEVEAAYRRALDLSQSVGEIPELFPVLRGLSILYTYLGEFQKGAEMGEKILRLAERQNDASMQVEGHLVLGYNLAFTDRFTMGMEHLEKAIREYDPSQYRSIRFRLGNHPGVASRTVSALLLWIKGFPDRSQNRANDAIRLAEKLNHPFSLAYALFHSGYLHYLRREVNPVLERAQAVLDLAEQFEFQVWGAVATCLQGAALAELGQVEAGMAQIRHGVDLYRGLKTPPIFLYLLINMQAKAYLQGGKPEQGLALLDEMISEISAAGSPQPSGENMMEPEILRSRGELLLAIRPQDAGQAELMFQQSLDLARNYQAQMMELRTAICICRLWREQGKADDGRHLLSSIYEKFTEGFTTADLVEARDLLSQE